MIKIKKHSFQSLTARGEVVDNNEIVSIIDFNKAFEIVKNLDYDALNRVTKNLTFLNDTDIWLDLKSGEVFLDTFGPSETLCNAGFLIQIIFATTNKNTVFDAQDVCRRLRLHYDNLEKNYLC